MQSLNQNQGRQASLTDRLRQQAGFVAGIASVFAAFGEVALFRTGFGERYFHGWKVGLVVPLIFLFPIFWPEENPAPLWWMLVPYLHMCIWHRLTTSRHKARGQQNVHSLYNGISRLEKRWPKVSEERLKCRHEPAVMLGMGLAALLLSPPLGWFFIWCAAGMAVHAGLLGAHYRHRALDLADAQIEGHLLTGWCGEPRFTTPTGEVVRIHGSRHVQQR